MSLSLRHRIDRPAPSDSSSGRPAAVLSFEFSRLSPPGVRSMNRARLFLATIVAAFLLFLCTSAFAQGVTTGAVSGTILNDQGQPVESAQIEVVNRTTGARTATGSRGDGRYYIQG